MTLTKYQSPATFEARQNANLGRSARDANLRLSVQNPALDAVLKSLGRAQPNRANLLIQSRTSQQPPQRSRSWFPFVPLVGAGGWPDDALAVPAEGAGARLVPADALQLLENIDWSNPAYTVALGAALLVSQIVALVQRQVLIHRLKPRVADPAQSDLFPETIVEPQAKRSAWDVDVATRQGKVRTENQDAIATLPFADGTHVMIVCDGAGGVAGGKEASHAAVEAIKDHLEDVFEELGQVTALDLKDAIAAARTNAAEKAIAGLTTALLVLLEGGQIHWATLGDGDVAIIWPDGMVNHVQVPHHTAGEPSNIINAYIGKDCKVPPRTGSQCVEGGALVLAMSDGASDLFPYEDVALNRAEITDITGLAESFLKNLEDARDPDTEAYLHNDNMSLAMARFHGGGEHDQ